MAKTTIANTVPLKILNVVAEGEGFKPLSRFSKAVFKTAHSTALPPSLQNLLSVCRRQ